MAIGQGYVQADTGVYAALQSAKGSVASTLKGALSFTKFEVTEEKEVTETEAMLGYGIYHQRAVGRSFKVAGTAEGWTTLSLFPALVFGMIATKTTTGSVAPFSHAYALLTRNINMKYASMYVVYGEASIGSGIQTKMIRDVRITSFTFTFGTTDAVKFSFNWEGLNEGPGAASPTLSFDSNFFIPAPVLATNTVTWPSWFPTAANICATQITLSWNANATDGPACLTTGEHSDIFLPLAGFDLAISTLYTSDMVQVVNQVNSLTASPSADATELSPNLKEGALSFLFNSLDVAGGSTPYSFAASFPSLQWFKATISNATPNMLTLDAKTFAADATFTIVNATNSAGMSY